MILRLVGARLREVVYIGDRVAAIAAETREQRRKQR